MDDLDFTAPPPPPTPQGAPPAPSAPFKAASSPYYKAQIAAVLFKASGRVERFEAGQAIFAEDQRAAGGGLFSARAATRMYFLAEGEVVLSIGGRPLDTLKPGEVFGEMAVISEQPRTATATAKTACAAFSLDAEEFRGALAKLPEFALMLMSVMFDRIRLLASLLAARKTATAAARESPVFDPEMLRRLEDVLPRAAVMRYWPGTPIMKEGQAGAYMYVVKSGLVAITIRERPLETVKTGGMFGEMALVDQSPRTATATAEIECELLAVDRPSLLAVVRQQPEFAMAMLRAVAARLRHMNAQFG